MGETVPIKALLQNGDIAECTISYSYTYDDGRVSFSSAELGQMSFSARDIFDALCLLRESLAKSGVRLLCVGARTDVYPSSMCRDMGGGLTAYVLPRKPVAVQWGASNIFDYAPPETIGTVAEQKEFYEKWRNSFHGKVRVNSEKIAQMKNDAQIAWFNGDYPKVLELYELCESLGDRLSARERRRLEYAKRTLSI